MPIVIPTVTFDPTKTIIPRKTYVTLTPSVAGVPQTPVSIIGKLCDYEQTIETTQREVPDADGFLRPDRTVPKKRTQGFKFEVEDVKTLAGAFAGSTGIEGGFSTGTAEVFIVDPDDAVTAIALHSNIFKASWQLDGGFKLTAGEVTKATIKIDALEKVVLTPNALLA
jgi:hypothetical protein